MRELSVREINAVAGGSIFNDPIGAIVSLMATLASSAGSLGKVAQDFGTGLATGADLLAKGASALTDAVTKAITNATTGVTDLFNAFKSFLGL